jgi:hypothetical protein
MQRKRCRTTTKGKHATLRIPEARLAAMVEEAMVDCYGESEQACGLFTLLEENLAVPFATEVLGTPVTVERVDFKARDEIVAVCTRARHRQSVPILDLPLPTPAPAGAEWIAAYAYWRSGA